MVKTVLLACPPPFIVSEMKPFLEQNGCPSGKIDSLADISAGVSATILNISPSCDMHAGLGKPDTYVFLSKDDLISPEQRALAKRIIQRHFH